MLLQYLLAFCIKLFSTNVPKGQLTGYDSQHLPLAFCKLMKRFFQLSATEHIALQVSLHTSQPNIPPMKWPSTSNGS